MFLFRFRRLRCVVCKLLEIADGGAERGAALDVERLNVPEETIDKHFTPYNQALISRHGLASGNRSSEK